MYDVIPTSTERSKRSGLTHGFAMLQTNGIPTTFRYIDSGICYILTTCAPLSYPGPLRALRPIQGRRVFRFATDWKQTCSLQSTSESRVPRDP